MTPSSTSTFPWLTDWKTRTGDSIRAGGRDTNHPGRATFPRAGFQQPAATLPVLRASVSRWARIPGHSAGVSRNQPSTIFGCDFVGIEKKERKIVEVSGPSHCNFLKILTKFSWTSLKLATGVAERRGGYGRRVRILRSFNLILCILIL